jgi:hypothetical protein
LVSSGHAQTRNSCCAGPRCCQSTEAQGLWHPPPGPGPGPSFASPALPCLAALTKRLEDHADGIENLAARPMANDMRLAAQVINRLVEAIGTAASAVNTAIARLIERATGH